ncbi:MAG: hypothetical protein OEV59_06115 [Deltaproteobacteria bacterium]|nr:hypothetical protein [Deltaproteobacteria bacterium]
MRRLRKYIRLLLFLSLSIGGILIISVGFKVNSLDKLLDVTIIGIVLGFFFGLGCIIQDFLLTYALPEEALDVHQVRKISLEVPCDIVFAKCEKILQENKKVRWVEASQDKRSILAETKMSWWSVGEKLEFNFVEQNGITDITIDSKPRLFISGITVMDCGVNFRNVESYVKLLGSSAGSGLQPEP